MATETARRPSLAAPGPLRVRPSAVMLFLESFCVLLPSLDMLLTIYWVRVHASGCSSSASRHRRACMNPGTPRHGVYQLMLSCIWAGVAHTRIPAHIALAST